MKTLTHVILPLAILAAVIGGVTFMSNYTPPQPGNVQKNAPPADSKDYRLTLYDYSPEFAPKKPSALIHVRWSNDPYYAAEFEVHGKHHHDFWFANYNPVPMKISVRAKSCQCSDLEMGMLPAGLAPDAFAKALRAAVKPATGPWVGRLARQASLLTRALGVGPLVAGEQAKAVTFQRYEPNGEESLAIPAYDPNQGAAPVGVVRFYFEGREISTKQLTAELVTRSADTLPKEIRLEIPVAIVPAVMVAPYRAQSPYTTKLNFGDVRTGYDRFQQFYCVSATRPDFHIQKVRVIRPGGIIAQPTPCIQVVTEKLSPDECAKLSDDPSLGLEHTNVRSAYRVKVHLRESVPGPSPGSLDQQLDLGPLHFIVEVTTDAGPPEDRKPVAILGGMVRGDVLISGASGKDQLALGSFYADEGTTQTVHLKTLRPGVRLSLVPTDCVPSSLRLRLEAAETPQLWNLSVTVPPHAVIGDLPPDSVVVLQTSDTPPRRIRIPVTGSAVSH